MSEFDAQGTAAEIMALHNKAVEALGSYAQYQGPSVAAERHLMVAHLDQLVERVRELEVLLTLEGQAERIEELETALEETTEERDRHLQDATEARERFNEMLGLVHPLADLFAESAYYVSTKVADGS